jgi:hypothetical protein
VNRHIRRHGASVSLKLRGGRVSRM